jgi:Domain of unknown function (DUF4331)
MEDDVRKLSKFMLTGAVALATGATAWMSGMVPLKAADHFDPPTRTDQSVNANADVNADIADVYMYHTATSLIVSIDFAGPRPPNEPARYDRDVLYTIFLSNAGSKIDPEITIDFRFGQDAANPAASGIRVAGLPGVATPLVGPVESTLTTANGIRVFSGLIDDPFNFDAVGLRLTRESGNLMFSNTRNRFAQMNSTAVVIEIPLALIRNGDNRITAWSTAARIIPA